MKLPDHWFYAAPRPDGQHRLDSEEARHATKALRLTVGDQLQWTDGRGGVYTGRIRAAERGELALEVLAKAEVPAPASLHLAIGTLRDATRLEWLCEKATELGATDVTLVQTARCERPRHRLHRLEARLIGALKQSRRAFLPRLTECSFAELLALPALDHAYVAHCYQPAPTVWPARSAGASARMLVGPEGDFTPEEVAAATAAGYRAVTLGEARLRSETAALAALVRLTAV